MIISPKDHHVCIGRNLFFCKTSQLDCIALNVKARNVTLIALKFIKNSCYQIFICKNIVCGEARHSKRMAFLVSVGFLALIGIALIEFADRSRGRCLVYLLTVEGGAGRGGLQ